MLLRTRRLRHPRGVMRMARALLSVLSVCASGVRSAGQVTDILSLVLCFLTLDGHGLRHHARLRSDLNGDRERSGPRRREAWAI